MSPIRSSVLAPCPIANAIDRDAGFPRKDVPRAINEEQRPRCCARRLQKRALVRLSGEF
jgi:hypothetical protein